MYKRKFVKVRPRQNTICSASDEMKNAVEFSSIFYYDPSTDYTSEYLIRNVSIDKSFSHCGAENRIKEYSGLYCCNVKVR